MSGITVTIIALVCILVGMAIGSILTHAFSEPTTPFCPPLIIPDPSYDRLKADRDMYKSLYKNVHNELNEVRLREQMRRLAQDTPCRGCHQLDSIHKGRCRVHR